MFEARLAKLCGYLEKEHVDAILISKPENIRYLSAFSSGADARLVVSTTNQYILTDGRYYQQTARECPDWELVKQDGGQLDSLASICDNYNSLLVESQFLSYDQYTQMAGKLKPELIPRADVIEQFRAVKDERELGLMREAARIGDRVFLQICTEIKVGDSEKDIANRIGFLLKEEGCDLEAFNTIAVAGENAALPHGIPGSRRLQAGDMLTLDFGGFYQGYAGDMTRTVVISKASSKLRDVYLRVLEAQQLGVSFIKAGIDSREVDRQIREDLQQYGLAEHFVHGTGHGVGLEVHEQPVISSRSQSVLAPNMVVTIEPGVYIPGWGGVRIEDMVIIKDGECEIITRSDKGLIIL